MIPLIGLHGDYPAHEYNRLYTKALRAVLDHNKEHAPDSDQYFDPAKYFFSVGARVPHHPTGRYNLRISIEAVPIGEAVGGWGTCIDCGGPYRLHVCDAGENCKAHLNGPPGSPPPEPDPCQIGILESACVSFFGSEKAKDKLREIILAQAEALGEGDDAAYAKGQADMAELAKETAAAGVAADSFVGRMQKSGLLPKEGAD